MPASSNGLINKDLRQTAEWMLWELESNGLDVSLGAAPERRFPGHKIRIVNGRNPQWYRDLCATYQSARGIRRGKFDTLIRRQSVIRALNELVEGRCQTVYARRLLPVVRQQSQREPEQYWANLFS